MAGSKGLVAAISIAILLDFLHAFARIHPFDPEASYGFPMEMDMKIATHARSIVIATALLATALVAGAVATAQEKYTPTPANLEARTWFQDAKFGMFIHWGVYSVLGDGEWIMETRPINRTDYAKVPAFFNPIKFDPAAWVAVAKAVSWLLPALVEPSAKRVLPSKLDATSKVLMPLP